MADSEARIATLEAQMRGLLAARPAGNAAQKERQAAWHPVVYADPRLPGKYLAQDATRDTWCVVDIWMVHQAFAGVGRNITLVPLNLETKEDLPAEAQELLEAARARERAGADAPWPQQYTDYCTAYRPYSSVAYVDPRVVLHTLNHAICLIGVGPNLEWSVVALSQVIRRSCGEGRPLLIKPITNTTKAQLPADRVSAYDHSVVEILTTKPRS